MYSGQAGIDYLATKVGQEDSRASSHWKKYHSDFRFLGKEGFEGLHGFGGSGKPYKGLRRVMTSWLQRRFRKMGGSKFKGIDRLAAEMVAREHRAYDLDVLRQALTVSFLKEQIPDLFTSVSTSCVIGDGFGSLTSLMLASDFSDRVVLVNLTKTLLVDLWFLQLWFGLEAFESQVDLVTDEVGLLRALAKPATNEFNKKRVIAIQASDHQLLRQCPVDIVLNIASMQEMDLSVITTYFDDMRVIASRRKLFFYCCNREEKILPDGAVIRFSEYPWCTSDQVIVDELCPWHQQYYTAMPPFFRSYDGLHRHRLVTFNKIIKGV
jgi:hypothetical protein